MGFTVQSHYATILGRKLKTLHRWNFVDGLMCELAVQVEIKRAVLGSVLLVFHRPRRCEIRRQVREDSKANYTMGETPREFGIKGRNTFLTSLRSSKFSLLTIQIQTTWNYVAFTCPSLNSKTKSKWNN